MRKLYNCYNRLNCLKTNRSLVFYFFLFVFFFSFSPAIAVTTPPVLTLPAASSYDNQTVAIDFTLPDAPLAGSVKMTFTRSGGTADPNSPHIITFNANFETMGQHTTTLDGNDLSADANVALVSSDPNDQLVHGSRYTVTISYQNSVGDPAASVSNTVVWYDIIAPTITFTVPADNSYRRTTQVSYVLSETFITGSITWTQTGGNADPGSPHVQALTTAELATTARNNYTLTNNPVLVDGAIYTVTFDGADLAGNSAVSVVKTNVTYDVTLPVISSTAPVPSSYVNYTRVSYTLSENLSIGEVRWTRTGGTADGTVHIQALSGTELDAGAHNDITLVNDPTLVSGTVYTVRFSGNDLAGNAATMISNTLVTYDITAPTITFTAPADNTYRNTTQVSYVLSEIFGTGSITWTWTGGSPDVGSPHVQALTTAELATTARNNYTLTNNPVLVDGAVYSVTFEGNDRAGNTATPVVADNVTYDFTVPTILGTAPIPSSYTNNTIVSYTLSEDFVVGEIRWTRSGGVADAGSPHIQALTGTELTAGAHTNITLTNDPTLVNGTVYTVRFSGNDSAGNAATMISNTLVTYDITVPTITAAVPASDAYRTTNLVSYTLSEIFASGFITWTRTGGVADPGSPHVQALTGTELNNGAHTNITLTNNPALVDGAVYTVTFDGQDRAGNNAVSVISTNVSYDYTAPAISATTPVSSTYIDNTQVSYTLSENLASGTIRWLRTGGTADPLSPQTKALTGNELLAGAHSGITLTNNPTLTNATVYTITFNGTDFAGLTATPVANMTITFDNTTPVFSSTAPATDAYVKATTVSYTLSENLMSGSITWTRTSGAADAGSPHILALVGSEMNAGAHTNITLTNNPTLVNGAVYSITFNGTDFASHAATPVVNTSVTYDITVPFISSTAPSPNSYVNHTRVSYTLSENLLNGSVQWARSGGAVDAGTPHNQALTGAELLSGTHTNITLTNDPALTDGTRYTVTFSGSDPAGNAATNVVNTIIWYDITAPVISATAPVTGSFVNSARVSYTLSEALALGTITWTRTGGAADGNSPHIKALTGPELNLGAHNNILLTNSPSLVDGATYSMMFNGTDNAANPAAPVMNTGIIYDAVAPTITSTTPVPNSYVNHTLVSYTLSEDFLVGEVRWTRGGGAADPLSPQMQALTGAELAAGAHDNITLTNNPSLVDGAYYTVRFSGNDLAGNAATPISNTVVWYDVTLPVITFTVPDNNTIQKSAKVSYVLAETFSAASITWTRTGGPADPASPHVQPLAVAELTTTARNNYTLVNNPILVDGAIYTVTFEGADRASNNAVSVVKTNVLYDFTLPVFSSTGPSSGSYVSNTLVSYTLSENLNAGTITWTRTGGVLDGGSPHVQALVGGELNVGAHSNVLLVNDPALVDGAIYSVAFNGTDAAGNAATTMTNTIVTYDITDPVISATAPITDASVKTKQVSYTLSEILQSGSITWTNTGGAVDAGSPHVQALNGAELNSGVHTNITLANSPILVDGAVYSMTYNGVDRAGHTAIAVVNTGITYDLTIPSITATTPVPNSYVNNPQVSYTLSEQFSIGEIRWTRTNGAADALSPHIQALTGTELNAGVHTNITLTNEPTLVDGARYTVAFYGSDSAGNAAPAESDANVWYDITVPVITFTVPATSSVQASIIVSYVLSETFSSGNITWTQTGGSADPGSPHVQALTPTELATTARNNYRLTNTPLLVDGGIYTVTFEGTDRAGNSAVAVIKTDVTYNLPLPIITSTEPIPNSYVNHTRVSYTLSEDFKLGEIRWTRSAGNADPLSPHYQALTGVELASGVHTNITLTNDPALVDGTRYTVRHSGTDLDGFAATAVSNANVWYDVTQPTITFTVPDNSAYRKNTQVSYVLSETFSTGSITWTRTGGTADPGSPHIQNLTAAERATTVRNNYTLTNNPILVDGAIYSVTFNGTDLAGNNAVPVVKTNVTYDVTLPIISSTAPIPSSAVNTTKVSYTLSENLSAATITWIRSSGTADAGSPHAQALSGAELNAGAHTDITLANDPTLTSGTVYTIAFSGTDLAGNNATTVSNTNVTFDNSLPVISATAPATDAWVKTARVSYTLSKALASGNITWTRTGGSVDAASPHIQALVGTERNAGAHTNITLANNPTLVNGAVYSVTFEGTDNIGNSALPVVNTGVTYDITIPIISSTTPLPNTYVNHTRVSYTFSEAFSTGTVTWTRAAGTADPLSPQIMSLTGTELNAGAHTDIVLTNSPTLTEGTRYTVSFNGIDLAGNAAATESNTYVYYDVTLPDLSPVAPTTGSFINSARVTYTASELLASGTVTWTRTSGAADPGSPYVAALVGSELNPGAHTNILLTNGPALVAGVIYSVTFNADDRAGNMANTIINTDISYNLLVPTITSTSPVPSTYVNHTRVSYTLSDNFSLGETRWTWGGGAADALSPHLQAWTGAELLSGAHTDITLANDPTLVDGAYYTVRFYGKDLSGNAAVAVSNANVWYDVTAPAITFTSPTTSSYQKTANVSYSLSETFSTGMITWTRTGGTADAGSPHVQALTTAELSTTVRTNYALANSPTLVEGTIYTITFDGADRASNNSPQEVRYNVSYDFTLPVISSIGPATGSSVNTARVSYTLSEGLGSGTVTWTRTGGTADGGSPHIQALTGAELNAGAHTNITLSNNPTLVNGTIYSVTFNGVDLAGNAASAVTNTSITYDNTVPSVIISGAPAVVNTTTVFNVTATFSETVTGFAAGDIVVTNGSASNVLGAGAVYTFDVTPSGVGDITINIPANVVQDLSANNNTAATPVVVTYDIMPPSVAIQNAPVYKNNLTVFNVIYEFSENVTGFVVGDITVTNGTKSGFVAIDGNTYTCNITPSGPGNITIEIAANVAQDAATNNNTAATQITVIYDATAPTIAIQNAPAYKNNTTAFNVTFQFSENVTGFIAGDITVTNATKSNFASVDGSTYTCDITPTGAGNITINVAAGVAQDLATNNNTAATQVSVVYDGTTPTVAIQNAPSYKNNTTAFNVTIKFSENVTGFDVGDVILTNASTSNFITVDGGTYTLDITPSGAGDMTIDVAAGTAQDAASNNNTAAPQVTIVYDITAPTIDIQNAPAYKTNNNPFNVTFKFNENVTGFIVGDITVVNATKSNFVAVNGNTYTCDLTPTGAGNISIDVAANVAQDLATNNNTAATQVIVIYDATAPTVAIQNAPAYKNNTTAFNVTIKFSEDVTGFVVGDITVVNAAKSNFIPVDGSTYTCDLTPSGAGNITIDVAGAVAQDAASNNNTAATQVSVIYDATAPTVAIQNAPAYKNNMTAFNVTIQFSEDVTGFVVGDITLANASASNFVAVDGSTYTADITPVGAGNITIDVAGAVAQDAASNNNTAATQVSVIYDATAPTVAIQNAPAYKNNMTAFNVTIQFSEDVTGFVIGDITLANA